MRRKNWVIPGFLVLAVLFLFSFPVVVLAEDTGTVPAEGETPASVQTGQTAQKPADDNGLSQGTDNVLTEDTVDNNSAPTESPDPGKVSENIQGEQTGNGSAPEKSVSADPGESEKESGKSGPPAPDDTEKPVPEPVKPVPSETAKPDAAGPEKQEPAVPVKLESSEPEKQESAGQGQSVGNTTAEPENESPSDTSTVEEDELPAKPENGTSTPDERQNKIDTVPVIVVPRDVPKEQAAGGLTENQTGQYVEQQDRYVVQPGDTVQKISEKTGVSVEKIKESNGLNVANDEVALPRTSSFSTDVPGEGKEDKKDPGPSITYRVRQGESLWLIGRSLGVPYEKIMAANNLNDHLIYPDQELIIPGIRLEGNMFRYRIKDGDTFYFIARALGLNYEELMSLNGSSYIWIYPGEELVVPDMKKVILYKVQEGETLSDIAKKFSVIKSMIYEHGVLNGKLVEDQVLVIPQNSSEALAENMQVKADAGFNFEKASDLDLLARAIYAEARGEVFEGKVAVGAVILNRLDDPAFPNTIRDIIFQPGAFTAVDDGQINLTPDQEAYRAARKAMNNDDPSMGALYYWNPEVATSQWIWSRPIIKQIGNHVFAR